VVRNDLVGNSESRLFLSLKNKIIVKHLANKRKANEDLSAKNQYVVLFGEKRTTKISFPCRNVRWFITNLNFCREKIF
jgi:phage pi2 protein 07